MVLTGNNQFLTKNVAASGEGGTTSTLVEVFGTFVGTISVQFRETSDAAFRNVVKDGQALTFTAPGQAIIDLPNKPVGTKGGKYELRVGTTAYTSGSPDVRIS